MLQAWNGIISQMKSELSVPENMYELIPLKKHNVQINFWNGTDVYFKQITSLGEQKMLKNKKIPCRNIIAL